MPENSTLEDIQYTIYVQSKIQKGLEASENEEVLSQKEVEKKIEKWFDQLYRHFKWGRWISLDGRVLAVILLWENAYCDATCIHPMGMLSFNLLKTYFI